MVGPSIGATQEHLLSLSGAVVAVTGGARGIGRVTAHAFRDGGALVAVGDLDGPLAGEVASGLPARRAQPAGGGVGAKASNRQAPRARVQTASARLFRRLGVPCTRRPATIRPTTIAQSPTTSTRSTGCSTVS